jgi:uncharacterized protein YecE (DUF72 family)
MSLMPDIYIGTAGWSYEDWEGVVYPQPRPRGFHPLVFLAGLIDIVEVNSTFYRPASAALALSWVRKLSGWPRFLLSVKLHQAFTHGRREFSGRDVDDFRPSLDLLELHGRLAALLIQFPWSFMNTPANLEYLGRLLRTFAAYPKAVEVRHASWDEPSFYGLLRENRTAFCNIDQPLFKNSIKPSDTSTSPDIAYVRLHGRNYKDWFREDAGRDDRYDYLYSADELEEWVERIRNLGRQSGRVYVITNNHYRGQALANALQIKNMLSGEKVVVPDALLQKYPVLGDIVDRIKAGQMALFREGKEDKR